jgi:hypothetical protein
MKVTGTLLLTSVVIFFIGFAVLAASLPQTGAAAGTK